jgi:two-component system, OmpR family, alkaline phosphatase synthesis response regulator PhoP
VKEKEKILLVEDEEDIRELMAYNLAREGFRTVAAGTGEEGLRAARAQKPDLVVLDLMLPGMDGLEVARRLKGDEETRAIPIVMVTAKGEEADIVTGLELGADDYLVKPFSPRVLVARVKAVLRRRSGTGGGEEKEGIRRGELLIHPGRRQASVKGRPLDLTFTEFNLLLFLARRPGWVFTRSQIVDAIRGGGYHVTDRAVDVHVLGLRKKMGAHGQLVETVRGVGYRFKEGA